MIKFLADMKKNANKLSALKQKTSYFQTQLCHGIFLNYFVASLGPWPLFPVTDAAWAAGIRGYGEA